VHSEKEERREKRRKRERRQGEKTERKREKRDLSALVQHSKPIARHPHHAFRITAMRGSFFPSSIRALNITDFSVDFA